MKHLLKAFILIMGLCFSPENSFCMEETLLKTLNGTLTRWTSAPNLLSYDASAAGISMEERQDGFIHIKKEVRRSSVSSSPHLTDLRRGHLQSYSPDVRPKASHPSHPSPSSAIASPHDMRRQHLSSHPSPSSVPASPSLRKMSLELPLSPDKAPAHSSSTRTSPQAPQFQLAPVPKEPSRLPSIVSSPAQGVLLAPRASLEPPPPPSSQRHLFVEGPISAQPSSAQSRELTSQSPRDPFNLWSPTPKDADFVLDQIPMHIRDILSNLAATSEWIWALTPKKESDANCAAEFDNLCADILRIKKNIQKKQTKKTSFEHLFNQERTYSLLYSIFSFQYMAWNGKDSTPVIQSYKNVVEAIWRTLTVDRNISLSSKYSILNYVLFLAEPNPIHKSFRPFSDPIFRNPSATLLPAAPRSFSRARQKHTLPIDLTIIKRCLRQEDDEFQRRTFLCTPKFRGLFEFEKTRDAFFNNLTFFQTNPVNEFLSQFYETYLYLYALVNFETHDLINALDWSSDKIYNTMLNELYRFYAEKYPSQPDFYSSLLSFQAKVFPTHTVHAYFDKIQKSLKPATPKESVSSPLSPSNPGTLSRHKSQSLGALPFKELPS